MHAYHTRLTLVAIATITFTGTSVMAGSHLWVINEAFSNADGTIQFVEMEECCGSANEFFIADKWVLSEATGNQFFFPENLPPGSTANAHLLLATAGFAALAGAPTPDYIIVDGFFDPDGDTLTYWFYVDATMSFGPGEVPDDGINSLDRDGTTGCNSPTNFDDETGYVQVNCSPADLDADHMVGITDFLLLLAAWGSTPGCPPDLDGGGVGITDFLLLLADWGPCS